MSRGRPAGTREGWADLLAEGWLIGALSDEDRAIGTSAIIAVRQTGSASGAAISGVVANLFGFGAGLTVASAEASAVWIYVAAIPLALAGALAAWRLTGSAVRATVEGEVAPTPPDVP